MEKMLSITLNGRSLTVAAGTPLASLLEAHPHPGPFQPVGALIDNRLVNLAYRLQSAAHVTTVDFSHREGMDIYRRTAAAILYAAFLDCSPDTAASIEVGQSIASGYFFEVHGRMVDHQCITDLNRRMHELVVENVPIAVGWTTVEDAMERFAKLGAHDKARLVSQSRRSEVPLVMLGRHLDFSHGPLAAQTGAIDRFALYAYEHGLVLDFPNERGELAPNIAPQPKIFATYLEAKRWNELVKTETVADLNEHCMRGTISDLIKVTEALHEKKIAAIADRIAENREIRLVLIAGPSGSGKTTFAKRLAIQLKIHGIEPVAISIDNYYRDHDALPHHADGSFDLECLEAIDVPLFNDHLNRLLKGEAVELPSYSFQTGSRNPLKAKCLQLEPGQVLITEGIHGLNNTLSQLVPTQHKFKIFVSALTQLCIDSHNRIFTTDTRLCRRIVRDRLFRAATAAETIAIWPSVRAGEAKYIFPFQEDADVIFNSALIYEHALLKPYAERFLTEIPREDPAFIEANRLARFFGFFIPILPDEVPQTSILREFVGGSAFRYK